jgi:hypothetical protein
MATGINAPFNSDPPETPEPVAPPEEPGTPPPGPEIDPANTPDEMPPLGPQPANPDDWRPRDAVAAYRGINAGRFRSSGF